MIKKSGDIIRVAIYLRVSTDEQAKEGYGLEYQMNDIAKLIEFKLTQSPHWVTEGDLIYKDEGWSGSNLERPGFKKMMEDAKRGLFDMVVVWKIDRMSRNLSHLLKVFQDLKELNVVFYSLKENIDFSGTIGKLVFHIFGALAEFEREMIQMRTSEGKKVSHSLGNYIGARVSYGYKIVNKKFAVVEEEAEIYRKMVSWFLKDGLSTKEIENKLNELNVAKGISTREKDRYTKWGESTIKKMFKNSIYKGVKTGVFGDTEVPKIISEQQYELLQLKLDEEKINSKKGGGKRDYLLRGLIYDLKTEKILYGYYRTKDKEVTYRRDKVVVKGVEYSNIEVNGKKLEDTVLKHIQSFISNPELFYKQYVINISSSKDIDSLREELKILEKNVESKNIYIDNVERSFFDGKISDIKRDMHIMEAQKDINNMEKSIDTLNKSINTLEDFEFSKEVIKDAVSNYNSNIENLSFDEKRSLVRKLVNKITVVKEDGKNIRFRIYFKFGVKNGNGKPPSHELSNTDEQQKNTPKGDAFFLNGRLHNSSCILSNFF